MKYGGEIAYQFCRDQLIIWKSVALDEILLQFGYGLRVAVRGSESELCESQIFILRDKVIDHCSLIRHNEVVERVTICVNGCGPALPPVCLFLQLGHRVGRDEWSIVDGLFFRKKRVQHV